MVNIIISGHGEIANGLKSSLNFIAGDFEHIKFINFLSDTEQLKLDMESLVKQNPSSSYLILVDLYGGTPFKTAIMLANEYKNIKVVSGVNLPMLLGTVFSTNSSLEELVELAITSGKESIK